MVSTTWNLPVYLEGEGSILSREVGRERRSELHQIRGRESQIEMERERKTERVTERERERETHTHRERERERERCYYMIYLLI